MDQATLVNERVEDGRKLIAALAQDGFQVTAASWLKETDGRQWYLYLASPEVDAKGSKAAYRELQETYRRLAPRRIGPFEVKLIRTDHPVAREVEKSHMQFHGPIDNWIEGEQFGSVPVLAAFAYGNPHSA